MVGLCLVAVFAVASVTATSASAVEKYKKSLKLYENCPVNAENPEWAASEGKLEFCVYAETEKTEGGQFKVGNITTPLSKPVKLQYGLAWKEDCEVEPETCLDEISVPPINGLEAITPTPEKVPGEPIANITPAEQEELGWPEGLKNRYREGQKKKTVKTVYETIELAGVPKTTRWRVVFQEGTGVEAPVMIKGENKWLSQLGDVCYIGGPSNPIVQHLTSGASTSPLTKETIQGEADLVEFFHNFEGVAVHSKLVDNTYAVPGATCTGPYSSYIEATINKEFGIPAAAGASVTELKGWLYNFTAATL